MSDTVAILAELGVRTKSVRKNWNEARLYETAVASGEARVAKGGALVVETGQHTGRSAKDKFTVRDELTENTVWWDNNAPMTPAHFDALWADFKAHLANVNFAKRLVLIGGTIYAGEIKKSVFTILNYLLPEQDVMPMHCSANIVGQGRHARSSSASPAPARPRCRPMPRAP
jgi:ATP-dependent phosphoenolpyruvate carboxykinase